MSDTTDPNGGRNSRYRFRGGKPVDPNEGVHPEMLELNPLQPSAAGIPGSPEQLIAMQASEQRPGKPGREQSAKVKAVFDRIEQLETSALDDQQIALFLISKLEAFHDEIVVQMEDDTGAPHSEIVAWAIDADRLMRARMLLESVTLH